MKKSIFIFILLLAVTVLMPNPIFAVVINGSFEDGLNGWDVEWGYHAHLIGDVGSFGPELDTPFPSYEPINQYTGTSIYTYETVQAGDPPAFVNPTDGLSALYLDMDQTDVLEFTGPDGQDYLLQPTYYLSVSQDVTMLTGERLIGSLAFKTDDFPPYDFDRAVVSVNGVDVFSLGIADAFDMDEYIANGSTYTPWDHWMWTAPGDGTYTLSITLFGDDQMESWLLADDIVHVAPVPEPSTMLLMGIGLIGMTGAFRKKIRKNN